MATVVIDLSTCSVVKHGIRWRIVTAEGKSVVAKSYSDEATALSMLEMLKALSGGELVRQGNTFTGKNRLLIAVG